MQIGRRVLTTDVAVVTYDNVIDILRDVEADFIANAIDCEKLLQFEAGAQVITREKVVRPEIDVRTVDNVAHEITEFKEGYHWGNTITFVQRGTKEETTDQTEAIKVLNDCYSAENSGGKQGLLGHFVEICGIGYSFVDIKPNYVDGDSYFEYEILDPRFAFVVRSSRYSDHRIMLGATFRTDKTGTRYFTVFSKDRRYEIISERVVNGKEEKTSWGMRKRSGEKNPLGVVPIIEYIRSNDRMGVFEREIDEMLRLNLILSDIGNDVDQECQQIWHANDVDFPRVKDANGNPTDEIERPKSNEWVVTETTRNGKTPFIKPLGSQYDYSGLMNTYVVSRALILQRCFTPQRNDNSGGSTGVAMSDATGWSSAEQVACKQQLLMEASKMDEVKVVLIAIKKNAKVDDESGIKKLRYMDVKPKITRQKNYELSVKSTALGVLISHGINGLQAIKAIGLFEDVAEVWNDSKETIEQYQKKAFGEENDAVKPQSDDPINQIGNTPLVDGISMETPVKEQEN